MKETRVPVKNEVTDKRYYTILYRTLMHIRHSNPYNSYDKTKHCFQRLWDAIKRNDLDLAEQCIRLKADVNYSITYFYVSYIYRIHTQYKVVTTIHHHVSGLSILVWHSFFFLTFIYNLVHLEFIIYYLRHVFMYMHNN